MPTVNLQNMNDILRASGRGVVLYAPGNVDYRGWEPGTGALALAHLGDTEGDISLAPNSEVAGLVLPEITGPAKHSAVVTGENPVLTVPLFLADPSLRDVVSPTGSRHGGVSARQRAKEYTLVIVPEALIRVPNGDGTTSALELKFEDGEWTIGGVPLSAEQLTLLAMSVWLWRGYFMKPPTRMIGAPDGKNIETVTFQVMHQAAMPEGHQLYTYGSPADSEIDLEGGS